MIGDCLKVKPTYKAFRWMLAGVALVTLMPVSIGWRFVLEHLVLVPQPPKTARFIGIYWIFQSLQLQMCYSMVRFGQPD